MTLPPQWTSVWLLVLGLLYLPAAFDTLGYSICFDCLKYRYGTDGVCTHIGRVLSQFKETEDSNRWTFLRYLFNSMQRYFTNLSCVCYCHLWELQRVCSYLTHKTAVKVAKTMVSSHLHYCNFLLYHTKKDKY